jgi:glycosyltransferase involved in cell wall biosynthesis
MAESHDRITINGRFLTQLMVGVQRVAIETTRALDGLLGSAEFAHLRGHIEILAPAKARDFQLTHIPVRRVGRLGGYPWEQIELPFYARGSLLLNLCLVGPVLKRRQLILAHDATVRAMPENFSAQFRLAYNILVPLLLHNSQITATVSEFSRGEIAKYYGIDPARLPVIYEGADHVTAVPADRSVISRLGIEGKPFLLGVGINSRNKNIENAIEAFLQAGLGDTRFVLTGSRELRVFGYAPETTHANIVMAGYVSDAELRALYENALALVFPSRYEGFGLPPVEAMQCGCPVIVSDQPALTEMGGDAVLTCGMDDVAGLARLMHDVYADATLRARLSAAGRERMKNFTWEKTARRMLALCLPALERPAKTHG